MILVIDNYDSFTFNLVQALATLGAEVVVRRNDAVTVTEVEAMAAAALVLSPGPGRPERAGITCSLVERLAGRLPILGVCLGHQAIGLVHGARVVRAPRPVHGQASAVRHQGTGLFAGLTSPFAAGRYHSLVLDRDSLPGELEVVAETEDGVAMALEHRRHPLWGVQFHPESILTPQGPLLLAAFLTRVRA